jgi:hypothetical protein
MPNSYIAILAIFLVRLSIESQEGENISATNMLDLVICLFPAHTF